ncbi:hypothetical protein Aduo_002879 [Ancylostoma duodenale]
MAEEQAARISNLEEVRELRKLVDRSNTIADNKPAKAEDDSATSLQMGPAERPEVQSTDKPTATAHLNAVFPTASLDSVVFVV